MLQIHLGQRAMLLMWQADQERTGIARDAHMPSVRNKVASRYGPQL